MRGVPISPIAEEFYERSNSGGRLDLSFGDDIDDFGHDNDDAPEVYSPRVTASDPPREDAPRRAREKIPKWARYVSRVVPELVVAAAQEVLRSSRASEDLEVRIVRATKNLSSLQAPILRGEPDPNIAERWISDIEHPFNMLNIHDVVRVAAAQHFLRDEAIEWWRGHSTIFDTRQYTWDISGRVYRALYSSYLS